MFQNELKLLYNNTEFQSFPGMIPPMISPTPWKDREERKRGEEGGYRVGKGVGEKERAGEMEELRERAGGREGNGKERDHDLSPNN